jgi:CRP/FNR family transcriptional regulator, cyclic AMP receptor protein
MLNYAAESLLKTLHKPDMESEQPQNEREKDDVLAHQYLSLATLYYFRGRIAESFDLLEQCKKKNPNLSKSRFLLGKILLERGDREKALEEFQKAKELDPFYEDIYKHLGILFSERKEPQNALEAFTDAYILSGGTDASRTAYYQRQIRWIYTEFLPADAEEYASIFEERRRHLLTLSDSLSAGRVLTKKQEEEKVEQFFLSLKSGERNIRESAKIASELRKFSIMQEFTEDELDAIAAVTTKRKVSADEAVFREDDSVEAVYVIEAGKIRIVKNTPFGEQILSTLAPGEFLGEMDFIDSLRSSADAIANEDTSLFSIDKWKLHEMFGSWKHLAIRFYWQFYKTLARRIRDANELLKTFFAEEKEKEKKRSLPEVENAKVASLDFEKKVAILREKGLTSKELRLLATLSNERSYKAGQNIFREGEAGEDLFIIAEGQVRISKHIAGIGEETLAILERGDFFGEMVIVDQQSRSADATAHTDVTVLPIDKKLLTECLSRDEESSYQFLTILCKILSHRLREINLKIYQWRMMSGGF